MVCRDQGSVVANDTLQVYREIVEMLAFCGWSHRALISNIRVFSRMVVDKEMFAKVTCGSVVQ